MLSSLSATVLRRAGPMVAARPAGAPMRHGADACRSMAAAARDDGGGGGGGGGGASNAADDDEHIGSPEWLADLERKLVEDANNTLRHVRQVSQSVGDSNFPSRPVADSVEPTPRRRKTRREEAGRPAEEASPAAGPPPRKRDLPTKMADKQRRRRERELAAAEARRRDPLYHPSAAEGSTPRRRASFLDSSSASLLGSSALSAVRPEGWLPKRGGDPPPRRDAAPGSRSEAGGRRAGGAGTGRAATGAATAAGAVAGVAGAVAAAPGAASAPVLTQVSLPPGFPPADSLPPLPVLEDLSDAGAVARELRGFFERVTSVSPNLPLLLRQQAAALADPVDYYRFLAHALTGRRPDVPAPVASTFASSIISIAEARSQLDEQRQYSRHLKDEDGIFGLGPGGQAPEPAARSKAAAPGAATAAGPSTGPFQAPLLSDSTLKTRDVSLLRPRVPVHWRLTDQTFAFLNLPPHFDRNVRRVAEELELSFKEPNLLRQVFIPHDRVAHLTSTEAGTAALTQSSISNLRHVEMGQTILSSALLYAVMSHNPTIPLEDLRQQLTALESSRILTRVGRLLRLDRALVFKHDAFLFDMPAAVLQEGIQAQRAEAGPWSADRTIISDAVKALIGAVFFDQGLPTAMAFAERSIVPQMLRIFEARRQDYLDMEAQLDRQRSDIIQMHNRAGVLFQLSAKVGALPAGRPAAEQAATPAAHVAAEPEAAAASAGATASPEPADAAPATGMSSAMAARLLARHRRALSRSYAAGGPAATPAATPAAAAPAPERQE